ncbi:Spy/CpxP family protein refolding chaperone [Bordetella sp. N]|uniref:Spy/CpxP family protein refolding chaperone n=1 Tax=Bordetella sp. N TaxID=1746199 RepID=UPI00070F37A8|nr:Spy/CpxP family protein refolding chaperone [Bordetella sp. N]ALM82654.1 hypothetical protein ASB57_06525 [Bordetella sp. N]
MNSRIALHAALWTAAALAGAPAFAQTATGPANPAAPAAMTTAPANAKTAAAPHKANDRVEKHIKSLHDQLKITSAQEAQWDTVAQTMRDNADQIDALVEKRNANTSMTALDDLNSYAEFTQANSDGVKKLAAVFTPLYNSLNDEQKKNADKIFSQGENRRVVHNKKPEKAKTPAKG